MAGCKPRQSVKSAGAFVLTLVIQFQGAPSDSMGAMECCAVPALSCGLCERLVPDSSNTTLVLDESGLDCEFAF